MGVLKVLHWLMPSPLSTLAGTKTTTSSSKIAALDGLRGIACLIVLNEHWTCAIDDIWGSSALHELSTGFMWQPFVILTWGGQAMVNLFFVMSGYALMWKPLSLLYSSQYKKMYEAMASAAFRRAFRLWLPTLAAVVIIAIMTRMRLFEPARSVYISINTAQADFVPVTSSTTTATTIANGSRDLLREDPPPLADSFAAQVVHVVSEFVLLGRAAVVGDESVGDRLAYDAHAWTIPVEFHSSMTVFIMMLGTSMLSSRWRLVSHGVVLLYCYLEGYTAALFIAGMIIAEIDLLRKHSKQAGHARGSGAILGSQLQPPATPFLAKDVDWSAVAWGICLLIGLYILSVPFVEPVTAPPFTIIARLLPSHIEQKNKLVRAIGAVMTTWSCIHSGLAAPLLTNSIASYLGKISFALYLTHGLVIRSLGYCLIGLLRTYLDAPVRQMTSLRQFMLIWMCGYIAMLPVCLWVADLFWRGIDIPSVNFARWLEQKLRRSQGALSHDIMAEDIPNMVAPDMQDIVQHRPLLPCPEVELALR